MIREVSTDLKAGAYSALTHLGVYPNPRVKTLTTVIKGVEMPEVPTRTKCHLSLLIMARRFQL
jgi:hypothetical protein